MKSSHWFDALLAHCRSHFDRGTTVTVTVGQSAKIMGCTAQTAKKHLARAVSDERAVAEYVPVRGCFVRIEVSFKV